MKKTICIISFSPIARDARVLRQIKCLSAEYKLHVIGYSSQPVLKNNADKISWHQLSPDGPDSDVPRLIVAIKTKDYKNFKIGLRIKNKLLYYAARAFILLGNIIPPLMEAAYWIRFRHSEATKIAITTPCDLYYANDWNTIPIAAKAAHINNAKLVIDLHEYAPLQYNNVSFKLFESRLISYIIKKYARTAAVSITVADQIASRYHENFDFKPITIYNTPEINTIQPTSIDPNNIKLIHHGGAAAIRNPKLMIDATAKADKRYSLHFMLIQNAYVDELKQYANKTAPSRIFFHDPVAPDKVPEYISKYDVGFYILPPVSYNQHIALPNKFFDFIAAKLAVCIGPSPSMKQVVEKFSIGKVSNSFHPDDIAELLNRTTPEEWQRMKIATVNAFKEFNADVEMAKLKSTIDELWI